MKGRPAPEPRPKATKRAVASKIAEWTPQSLIMVGAAAVLAMTALVLGYSSVRRWMFKTQFSRALAAFDRNSPGTALPALEHALSWQPDSPQAVELHAKIKAEDGTPGGLAAAEEDCKRLMVLEEGRPETAACGLGVVALLKADRETDSGAVDGQLQEARKQFQLAKTARPGMVEAEIGLLHCSLLSALRARDAGKLAEAAAGFERILNTLRSNPLAAQAATQEGIIDLYAGLGRARAATGQRDAAYAAFKGWLQYDPRHPVARRNAILLEARRFAESTFTRDDLSLQLNEIRSAREKAQILWMRQKSVYGGLEEAWFQYALATAYIYGRFGDLGTYYNLASECVEGAAYSGRLEARLVDAAVRVQVALVEPPKELPYQEAAISQLATALERLAKVDFVQKPEGAGLRAAVLNDQGCAEEFRGRVKRDDGAYEKAVSYWKEAMKAEALAKSDGGAYEACRNIAVVQHRRKMADEAREHLGLAEKAAQSRPEAWVKEDLEAVKKSLAEEAPR